MKMANACNPILDTFRTISRCGTKLQTALTLTVALIVTLHRAIQWHVRCRNHHSMTTNHALHCVVAMSLMMIHS